MQTKARPRLKGVYKCSNCKELRVSDEFIGAFNNVVGECQECRQLRKRINKIKKSAKNSI